MAALVVLADPVQVRILAPQLGSVRCRCEHVFVRGPRYSEAEARAAIASSSSFAEALRKLDLRAAGGNWRTLKRYATEVWRIPIDHFDPHSASRAALGRARTPARPLDALLTADSGSARGNLKRRLYQEGIKERRCELCGQGEEWRGRRMALILDHINGIGTDNRLENLRIVCPNCAATLDTHCGRNMKLVRPCAACGVTFHSDDPDQRHCSQSCGQRSPAAVAAQHTRRRVERPPYEQLRSEVEVLGWSAVGRKYGVSDNAVRKWMRAYERFEGGVGAVAGGAAERRRAGPEGVDGEEIRPGGVDW
jgi:hypothetical protein